MTTAAAPAPRPPLPYEQVLELLNLAARATPTTGSTLVMAPLGYHGLINNAAVTGTPQWSITARGRAWLAAHELHRSHLATKRRKLSRAQLVVLATVSSGRGSMGTVRTREVLYRNGLINWEPIDERGMSWTWRLTNAGAVALVGAEMASRG